MVKNKSCDVSTRKIIVQMHHDGSCYQIATALKASKSMVFEAVQYFRKHSTAERVSRKQRSRITIVCNDALMVREPKIKFTNEIRISAFGENGANHLKTQQEQDAGLFGRISRKKPLLSERNRKKRI